MIKDLSLDNLLRLLEILENIKHLAFYTKEGELVVYPSDEDLNRLPNEFNLSSEEKRFFVFAIQNERAVKVLYEYTLGRRGTPYRWSLEVDKSRLGELESEVKQIYKDVSKGLTSNSEKDYKAEIEMWLADKSERTLRRMWRVVRAIRYEWELRDQDSFPVPHGKFGMFKVTNTNDLEAILTNLHSKKFIFISRKVGETPPSNDPNKPSASLWEPITDNPKMIHESATKLEVLSQKFKQLVQILERLIAQKDTEKLVVPTEENKPLASKINLTDTASRYAYENKWDILQAMWDIYESHSRPDSILVPVARLTIKGREVEIIDEIIEGFKGESLFKNWERKDRWYNLEFINHEKLPEVYKAIGEIYKKFVTADKEQNQSNEALDSQTETTKNPPYCVVEKGVGYLKFGKYGNKRKIGGEKTRHFRLLQALLSPLGVAKTVDSVFESIKLSKDQTDTRLSNWNTGKTRKVELIEFAIKELQKGNKLDSKIRFEFDDTKTQIMAKFLD
ncbi:MAG: hypothetical protein Q7R97_00240 [Candidatus Daviesbacteria bacterium]|nr:hypothetical protein [Candidatus Daviesbacteria bacterium]